jgi:outer membrane protein insertion porin family
MILLILVVLSTADFKVETITIRGNEYFNDGAMRAVMLTKTPSLFHRGTFIPTLFDGDITAIRNLYSHQGFLETTVDYELAVDSIKKRVNINIDIKEGTQTFIKEVIFTGNTIFADSFLCENITIQPGAYFDIRKIDVDNYVIISLYDDKGYTDVDVQSEYAIEDHKATVVYTITEDEQQFIKIIELVGLEKTREDIVRRAISLEPNDTLRYANILKSQRKLYNLGVFQSIRTKTTITDEPNFKIVQFTLKEKEPIIINVRIGYGTQDYLRFGAGLTHLNILGRAWSGNIQGKLSFAEYRLDSQITFPQFLVLPIKTTLGTFYQFKREIGFNTRRGGGYIATHFNLLKGNLSTKYDAENIRTYYTNYDSVENDWLHGLTINWLCDRRNDPFSTRSGYYVNMNFETGGIIIPSDVNYIRPTFEYRLFKPIQIFVFAYSWRLGYVRATAPSTEVPPYKRFYCGGTTSVRGYSEWMIGPVDEHENPRGGNVLFEMSAEMRFPIYKIIGGVFFIDGGNIWQEYDEVNSHLRWGIGAGLRLMTPLGSIRFDYGLKLGRQPEESAGALHFAIGESF